MMQNSPPLSLGIIAIGLDLRFLRVSFSFLDRFVLCILFGRELIICITLWRILCNFSVVVCVTVGGLLISLFHGYACIALVWLSVPLLRISEALFILVGESANRNQTTFFCLFVYRLGK